MPPLVKVTPDNAVPTVRDQVSDFRSAVGVAGRSPALLKLGEQAEELLRLIEARTVEVELLLLDNLHPLWTAVMSKWLELDPGPLVKAATQNENFDFPTNLAKPVSVIRIRGDRRPAGRRAGARVAPVFVVAHGSKDSPDKALVEDIVQEMKRRPLTMLLAPKEAGWAQGLSALGSREAFLCRLVELEGLMEKNLQETMTRPPWLQAGHLACAWSAAGALAEMHEAFSVALENEERSARAKRVALEQQSGRQGAIASPTEILAEVRGYLQKQFEGFQRGVSTRLSDLVAPFEGRLTREVEAEIEEFSDFEFEKKPKTDVLRIPTAVEQSLLRRIADNLGEALRSDIVRLHDLFRDAQEYVEHTLEVKGAPPVAVHFRHLQQSAGDTLIGRSGVIQRPYKGEISRRGPMDFFMAARRYQMIFFMVFSAFGLSFIRQYTMFTVPLGIMLLAFGMVNVVNAARKQRAESIAKELDKAREGMRTELRRAMNDIQKNWEQLLSNHLASEQATALELIESTVKTAAEKATREAVSGKELLQQQLKNLDAAQKKISDGIKKSEQAAVDLKTLTGQLTEFYAATVRPPQPGAPPAAGGRPAVPGVPGAVPGVPRPAVPGVPGVAPGAARPAAPAGGAPSAAVAEAMAKLQALQGKGGAAAKPAAAPAAAAPAAPAAAPGRVAADMDKAKAAMERLKALQEKRGAGGFPPKPGAGGS